MSKTVCITLLIINCFLANIQAFAQTPLKYKSKDIYDFCQQIQESAKNRIWDGFDFKQYSRLETNSKGGSIIFSYDHDDANAFAWRMTDETFGWRMMDVAFEKPSLEQNLAITFHEAFHGFQRSPKRSGGEWRFERSQVLLEYPGTDPRNGALFAIESRILQMALQAKNRRELDTKIRHFLAVRKLRQSELEPHLVEFEMGAESNEGIAEYVATKAVEFGLQAAKRKHLSVPFAGVESKEYLQRKYEILNAINTIGRNVRRKFYYTGSAQSLLLDRLTSDWKAKVQMESKSLQDILSGVYASSKHSLTQLDTAKLLLEYNYEATFNEELKAAKQRENESLALLNSTLGQRGRLLAVDYSSIKQPAKLLNFDVMNVVVVRPKLRIHLRGAGFSSDNVFTARFAYATVEDLEKRRYQAIVPENESLTVTIDGETLDFNQSVERQFSSSIVVSAPKLKLEGGPGSIRITRDGMWITLFDKK